jgi:hypothetical protein
MPMGPNPNMPSPFDGLGMERMGEEMGPEKQDQRSVSYQEGTPGRSCGSCVNFVDGDMQDCRLVEGPVSRAGVCDLYEPSEGEATENDDDD